MNKWIVAAMLAMASMTAQAAVEVTDAWARATPPGQDVGAAYLNLKSDQTAKLISVKTSVADSVEIHEMTMVNDVMKMRMMETLPLPKGKVVKLAPGGFHLMLFDLRQPLAEGETIELELLIKNAKGKPYTQTVRVPVKAEAE